ncbi:hypothetical protein TNCV_2593601 [Trichonephila clavipes]|nr:hypothetical protein TNCV_2593601 [Trichonephila clavipes]
MVRILAFCPGVPGSIHSRGSPLFMRADQKAKRRTESSQPEVLLTLRRAKNMISTYIDKCTVVTKITKSLGNLNHCRSYPEAPGESRGRCPLLPNHRK